MTKKDERMWERIGIAILVLWLLTWAFQLGHAFGIRQQKKNEEKAIVVLEDALDTIESTDLYHGSVPYEDVTDVILDDVRDALAWLTLEK